MDRGMKIFIIVASIVVAILVLAVPSHITWKKYQESQRRQHLLQIEQLRSQAAAAIRTGQFEKAEGLLEKASATVKNLSGSRDEQLANDVNQSLWKVRDKAKEDRERRVVAEAEAARRAAAERAEALAAAERQRQANLAREQARKMYPDYKASAEKLADYLLKFISATQAGLTMLDHRRMEQEMMFEFNKFKMRCSAAEVEYQSFKHLTKAVEEFQAAGAAWSEQFKTSSKALEEVYKRSIQQSWSDATEQYQKAMSAMAKSE